MRGLEAARSEVLIEQSGSNQTRVRLLESEREVFGLKYLIFDSAQTVNSIMGSIKGYENKPIGIEILKAKELLEKNPENSVLITDMGLSLWSKAELRSWLNDYSVNSLSPQRMSDFIFRLAQENPRETQMPVAMAKRMANALDKAKNFELQNREEINLFNDGAEVSSLSFLFRSIYRRTLVEKRLEFLKAIEMENPLLKLNGRAKEETLQTLAMFPEFLYHAEKSSKFRFKLEAILSEGGMVFSSNAKRIKVGEKEFNVTLKVLRFVDDVKAEVLNLVLVVEGFRGATVGARDVIKIKEHVNEQWLNLSEGFSVSQRLRRTDLEFDLERNDRDTAQDLIIRMAPEVKQLGYEPYLVFGLFTQL